MLQSVLAALSFSFISEQFIRTFFSECEEHFNNQKALFSTIKNLLGDERFYEFERFFMESEANKETLFLF